MSVQQIADLSFRAAWSLMVWDRLERAREAIDQALKAQRAAPLG